MFLEGFLVFLAEFCGLSMQNMEMSQKDLGVPDDSHLNMSQRVPS